MKKRNWGLLVLTAGLLTAIVGSVSAQEIKKLYFEEKNGSMTWNPVRGSDGNWFMDFTNMVPGGRYEDNLQIENGSDKTWKLYMQAVQVEQDEEKDRLLEQISMKVLLDKEELYNGTASGREYENGNLQDVIYLGTYEAGKQSHIVVELELNKDIGIEYNNKLTKSDWKFMVTEVEQSSEKTPPQVIQPPKTGDSTNFVLYQALMAVSLLFMFGIVVYRMKKRFER